MMHRAIVVIAVSATLALAAIGFAPTASAAQGNLAGHWTSVDTDGSNQTLDIMGSGNRVYAMFLTDDRTSGVCGGSPAQATGAGFADGDFLFMRATLICLPGGNPIPRAHVFIAFEYDAAADTLTDNFGVEWHRAG